uniref:ribosomal protein L29 n=1 Tax=Pseudoerythrocladia kornmannii TaxID=753682 RepID=UPI001BF102BC|nr:ribosomal protein L29 [Pseudoerythrocladia kornmannii]QUE28267.1 ribosomal protein L29 [Pseudoerythrocladia kornmannii]UNJ16772.1 ribosomal protein L29 [Pseudoerythrocladia kornmannii]
MGKSNIQELRSLNLQEIESKIIATKKEIFSLRLKKATKQLEKTHLFKENKNLLAQLLMVEKELTNK